MWLSEGAEVMKINIYYGGRGVLDDPALYVIEKMEKVLEELNVQVERFNIYEQKHSIETLPQTLKDADGIILAVTVEWLGIGGYMQQFLDACWLYGDKEKISTLYMLPVAMSITHGEKEAALTLINAWEMLGGMPCSELSGYVDDLLSFEMNEQYTSLIEKTAENLYRSIRQKYPMLPTSNQAVKKSVLRSKGIELTPQESEQLSKYASDDSYVKQQKEDIQELSNLFKGMLSRQETEAGMEYVKDFESHFHPQADFKATYRFQITDKKKNYLVEVNNTDLKCYYGAKDNVDVDAKLSSEMLQTIIRGKMTFQRAFMSGEMTAKGDFQLLRMLDQLFVFG